MSITERRFHSGSNTWRDGHWKPVPPLRDVTQETKATVTDYIPLALPESEALVRVPKVYPLVVGGRRTGDIHLDERIWKEIVNAGVTMEAAETVHDVLIHEWYPGGQKGHTQGTIRLVQVGEFTCLGFDPVILEKFQHQGIPSWEASLRAGNRQNLWDKIMNEVAPSLGLTYFSSRLSFLGLQANGRILLYYPRAQVVIDKSDGSVWFRNPRVSDRILVLH